MANVCEFERNVLQCPPGMTLTIDYADYSRFDEYDYRCRNGHFSLTSAPMNPLTPCYQEETERIKSWWFITVKITALVATHIFKDKRTISYYVSISGVRASKSVNWFQATLPLTHVAESTRRCQFSLPAAEGQKCTFVCVLMIDHWKTFHCDSVFSAIHFN